ncbi:uncharacterized protein LOC34623816 [Cyclospora cayetanensis]|uniref:Uncharacterized protein LOC34623816 n=1 Tax=Cyclospora cayetanensis TaxID=88456 RepID=A0A6P6RUA0_9EIME|nr:uncharacterized protein LOC34623816 [Cyclospora cayetanensis]
MRRARSETHSLLAFAGCWKDFGLPVIPRIPTLRSLEEPPLPRLPLKFWTETRGVSSDWHHYPLYEELFNQTVLDPGVVTLPEVDSSSTSTSNSSSNEAEGGFAPLQLRGAWEPQRDRLGLGYGDARIFEDWPSWDPAFALQVAEATNLTLVPQSGEYYQKFYIGPLPHGGGWTLGSVLKSFALHRSPGYGVTGVYLHSPSSHAAAAAVAASSSRLDALASRRAAAEASLCLDFQVEWGRGLWLGDLQGLYREEEGFNYRLFKRRPLYQQQLYPTSCYFGACNRMRIAVHKLMGSRWCSERMECPDPKEQLVVEIWSSRKATPKEVLLHALREVQLAAASARSQLKEDVDWAEEERALQGVSFSTGLLSSPFPLSSFSPPLSAKCGGSWGGIAERQQELQGGPPVFIFDAKGDFRPADPESAAKALPLTPPPVNPTEVSELRGVSVLLLLQCGVYTLGNVALYSHEQLLRIPGVGPSAAALLQQLLLHRYDKELPPD